jgi:hypothetical protein
MAELLDANWFRTGALGTAAFATVAAWRIERVQLRQIGSTGGRALWPMCWLLIGAIYASMALVLTFDLVGTFGGLGREYARADQWYESRRPLQVAVVTIVGLIWFSIIVVGIWRVPERRRRYLPSALLCTTLVCFAIIRLVSLHQIDTIVYRTSVAGVPIGTVVEHVGVVLAVVLIVEAVRRPVADSDVLATHLDPQPI